MARNRILNIVLSRFGALYAQVIFEDWIPRPLHNADTKYHFIPRYKSFFFVFFRETN